MTLQCPTSGNAWKLLAGSGDHRHHPSSGSCPRRGPGARYCSSSGSPRASTSVRPWSQFITGAAESKRETRFPIVIKTRSVLYSDVEAAIRKIHPYDTPEIIAIPVVDGDARYLAWIAAETTCALTRGARLRWRTVRARVRHARSPPACRRNRSCCRRSRRSGCRRGRSIRSTIEARFDVADGYYLYRDRIHFSVGSSGNLPAELPRGQRKHDEFFGDVETYRGPVVIRVPLPTPAPGRTLDAARRFAGMRGCRRLLSAQPAGTRSCAAGGRREARARSSKPRRRRAGSSDRARDSRRSIRGGTIGECRAAARVVPRRDSSSRRRVVGAAALAAALHSFAGVARAPAMARRCWRRCFPTSTARRRRLRSGAARCWWSTSGRRGARRVARRCRSSSLCNPAMLLKACNLSASPSIRQTKSANTSRRSG